MRAYRLYHKHLIFVNSQQRMTTNFRYCFLLFITIVGVIDRRGIRVMVDDRQYIFRQIL